MRLLSIFKPYRGGIAFMAVLCCLGGVVRAANPSNGLRVEVIAAPNFVVDSNVETPATYGPRAAYIAAKFHNDGTNALTDVFAYIGNYNGGIASTPGYYPARTNPASLTGVMSLAHEGGSAGTGDATRYLGTIQPGASVTVYWLTSYPLKDQNGKAVFGAMSDTTDDLWLNYDVWVSASRAGTPVVASDRRTATLRRELSAMANKIFPNGANKVPMEFQNLLAQYAPTWDTTSLDGSPGTEVTMEGIWYDLGVVDKGFDADGDLMQDNDAWLQPVGDPSQFDSSCLRLVKTYTLLVVKLKTGEDMVITEEDKLYFKDLPANNGVVGYVRYDFLPLQPNCSLNLTPYQEAASGSDNEKFNGDFGAAGIPPLGTTTSAMEMVKSASLAAAQPGENITYSIAYTNTGSQVLGNPLQGMPLVVGDHLPPGARYVAGSATNSNVLPAGVAGYTALFSTNNGTSWLTSEPAVATAVTDIQWWLSDVLGTGAWGRVSFAVQVASPYIDPNPVMVNTGAISFGRSTPFLTSRTETRINGTNQVGDRVFADTGVGLGSPGNRIQDGAEPGLASVLVNLYWDANSNRVYDAADVYLASTNTDATGAYLFTGLADGNFVVRVDATDADIPIGYTPTTPVEFGVNLDAGRTSTPAVVVLTADFGFAPALSLTKTLITASPLVEGRTVSYRLTVTNTLPGNGTGAGQSHTYTTWARTLTSAGTGWESPGNLVQNAEPNSRYATNTFSAAGTDTAVLKNFSSGYEGGSNVAVKVVLPMLVTPSGKADYLTVALLTPGGVTVVSTNIYTTNMTSSTFLVDISYATNRWEFLADTNATMNLTAKKGGSGGTVMYLDAVGLRMTTDQIEGQASATTTLDPVPLTDVFDASFLRFVSASVTPTSVGTNGIYPNQKGTLTWANLGPIYPGGGRDITVNFEALEPQNISSNTALVVTNVAIVNQATFTSGRPAGASTNPVAALLQPAGSIGDFVWRDVNSNGVQNVGEPGIPNVRVVLAPPTGIDAGAGVGVPVTNTTDSTGYYLFKGLLSSASYTVTVMTATLPTPSFTNTFDEDGNRNSQTVVTDLDPSSINGFDKHLTADFGYFMGATIDGTVWNDMNRNGASVPDSGEPWIAGVTVRLYSSTNLVTPIATTNTGSNGYFSFTGNYAGDYVVMTSTNAGTLTNSAWIQTYDSDSATSAGLTNKVALSVTGGGTAHADFSYYKGGPFILGDTLYYDWNGNGAQNTNDEGIASVPVSLYHDANSNGVVDAGVDALVGTTTTTSNGLYQFSALSAGNYVVVVNAASPNFPPRYTCTGDPSGARDGISAVALAATNLLQDFGYQAYGSGVIGDTVWRDINGDGLQAGGQETGIASAPVSLYVDANGDGAYVLLATTNTDSQGRYLFADLPDSRYRVAVDLTSTNLPLDALGVRYAPSTPVTVSVTLSNAATYLAADFGFKPYGAIGDTIFWDLNGNGIQDGNESGVSGAIVNLYGDTDGNGLYGAGDVYLTNRVTNTNGLYVFSGLSTGRYVVVVGTNGVLSGMTLTADPDADGLPVSEATNSNAWDGAVGVNIGSGTFFMGADFGFKAPGSIGDLVWLDLNSNGVRDEGEVGIPNVPVVVYSHANPIATNRTDTDGYYGFGNLPDGDYFVGVLTSDPAFPSGLTAVYDADGTPNSMAGVVVISGGHVTSVGGTPRTDFDLGIDFGYKYAGNNSLSGTVGLDALPYDGVMGTNATGVSSNESPFADMQVNLLRWRDANSNGVVEAGETTILGSTVTGTNGDYSFTGLPTTSGVGTNYYIVSMVAPQSDLKLTTTNGCTPALWVRETTNSAGDTLSAYQVVRLATVTTNIDFAFKSTLSLDYGDLPSVYGTLLTDTPSGARHIVAITPTLLLGTNVTTEVNGQPTADASGDSADDGVTTSGIWSNGAAGGALQIRVGKGTGWLVGFIDYGQKGSFNGANDLVINQAVSTNGGNGDGLYNFILTVPTNAISATNATTLYARFRLFPAMPAFPVVAYSGLADNGEVEDYCWKLGVIRGLAWRDANGDEVKQAGEGIFSNVTVFVDLDSDGLRDAGEPAAVTDGNGAYSFGGLPAGDYRIVLDTTTLPSNQWATYDVDGGFDSLADITLAAGEVRSNVDFGYQQRAAIGDTVWLDANNNGVINAGEVGISNILVILYSNITVVASNRTDGNGYYGFSSLLDGLYSVAVVTNDGSFPLSPVPAYDADGVLDSRASTVVISNAHVVSVGGTSRTNFDLSLDFGYYYVGTNVLSGTIGRDAVPYDGVMGTTASGVSTNEQAFTNVQVNLYLWQDVNTDGNVDLGETPIMRTTMTDAAGDYRFTGLPFGASSNDHYLITFESPYADLKLTTTTGCTTATSVSETTNVFGDTVSATQIVPIVPVTTNIDFAYKSNVSYDYGDLPASYGTSFTNSIAGPRHLVLSVPDLVLGATVDMEKDGVPTVDASGDGADEDGVQATGLWQVGPTGTTVTVTVGKGAGWLTGYIDFGRKGAFTNSGDLVVDQAVSTNGGNGAGVYSFPVTVPSNSIAATTTTVMYARFRLFPSQPANSTNAFTGTSTNGEVEDYRWLLGAVSGVVWNDANGDTMRQGGESTYSNVTVFADLNTNGVLDAGEPVTATSTNGAYGIGGLPAGTFRIVVVTNGLPAVSVETYDLDGGQDNRAAVTLTAGQVVTNADFGYLATNAAASLGDWVWVDSNGNGIQDAGEPALSNATVILYQSNTVTQATTALATNVTGATGFYGFNGLLAGTYRVQFVLPAGYAFTTANAGVNQAVNSKAQSDGYAAFLTLTNGQKVLTQDAGAYLPVTISGSVWADLNGNGVADPADTNGIPDSTVVLLDGSSNIVATAITGVSGLYAFTNLPPGTYTLVETNATGYDSTGDRVTPLTDDRIPVGALTSGQSSSNNYFLDAQAGSISGYVMVDWNGDGVVDVGDTNRLAGVVIELIKNGSVQQTTTTAGNGAYSFTGLNSGTYTVRETDPAGYISTTDADGGATTNTITVVLAVKQTSVNNNFYDTKLGLIGDYVWHDLNGNGIQDGGSETGMPGLVVSLYDVSSNVVGTTTTSANGIYGFADIRPATYLVGFSLPSGYTFTAPAQGGYSTVDSNPDQGTGRSSAFALYSGETNKTVDAGVYRLCALSGSVTLDVNGDGIKGAGDTNGIAGSTLLLFGPSSNLVARAVVGADGGYSFSNLPPGSYVVREYNVIGYTSTGDATTPNDDRIAVSLTSGQSSTGNNFWDVQFATVGGRTWLDENRDGFQDAGEAGLAGVMVLASNVTGLVVTNWTDAYGGYVFKNLVAGNYTIAIPASNTGTGGTLFGMSQTLTNPVAAGGDYGNVSAGYSVTLSAGVENLSGDFGFNWVADTNVLNNTGRGAIGDRVWHDANGNGFQDPGELGATGVVMSLYYDPDTNGVYDTLLATTITDGNGRYVFTNLLSGAYAVSVASTNFAAGGSLNGFTQTGDPDHFGTTGANDGTTTIPVILSPGDLYVNADFGYRPPAALSGSVGGTVWIDANASGTSSQDSGEVSLGNVSVSLIGDRNGDGLWSAWGADGLPGTADDESIVATGLTGTNGVYRFDGVLAGSYIVWVNDTAAVLSDLQPTYDANGTASPSLSAVALSAGSLTNLVQSFSYAPLAQYSGDGLIGDRIFLDRDRDGVWTPGEGLEGVAVELRDSNSNLISQVTTDDEGRYLFGNLGVGTYRVVVLTNSLPSGLTNSVDPDGGSLNQSVLTVGGGQSLINLVQDFGYRAVSGASGAIQGTVWNDLNANGIRESGDAGGLAGVTVDLYWDVNSNGVVDAADPVVARTTSQADGGYAFTNLGVQASYVVNVSDEAGVLAGWWHSLGVAQAATNSQTDPVAVTLTGGSPVATWVDFGYYLTPASLGNRVWRDDDKDGLQDAAEPGIHNALLTLRVIYPDGTTNWVVTTTDASGYYRFGNLLLDEQFNGDGVGSEPSFRLTAWASAKSFVAAKVDVGSDDWIDSDNPAGVVVVAIKGVSDVSLNTAHPALESAGAKYDFGFEWKPTLVKLTGFGAFSQGTKVWVTWETAEERDTAGFYLERLVNGVYVPVNGEMIPSQFWSLGGAVYEQLDQMAAPGQTYTYRLIEQETSGVLRYLGPWLVTVDGPVLSFEEWSRLSFGAYQVMAGVEEGADADGDGMSNLAEFQAGTDPMNAASALMVSTVRMNGASGFELVWTSVANRAYTIEWSTNLTDGFTSLPGIQQATPPQNTFTVPVIPGAGAVFYRVKIGP